MKPYLPPYLKTKNRRLIFDLLREKGKISRTEAAKITGLSLPTVMKAAEHLLDLGILTESADTDPSEGAGRKGHLLEFHPRACLAVSVIFEGQIVSAGLMDLNGNCLKRYQEKLSVLQTRPNLSSISALIQDLAETGNKMGSKVLGVGIGFPAVINPESKSVMQLPSWGILEETPFETIFPQIFDELKLPYFLDNDVNLACMGEAFLRRKQEICEDLLYLSLGTGCGAGILLGGTLWRGKRFRSGEIGDVLISPSPLPDPASSYMTGFENHINLAAILRKFHVDLTKEQDISSELTGNITEEISPYLSFMMYNLAHILDIDRCVLTGIIPEALGEPLFTRLQASIDTVMLPSGRITIQSSVSKDAGLAGGAVAVFDSFLEDIL